jgi:hypothetical protein
VQNEFSTRHHEDHLAGVMPQGLLDRAPERMLALQIKKVSPDGTRYFGNDCGHRSACRCRYLDLPEHNIARWRAERTAESSGDSPGRIPARRSAGLAQLEPSCARTQASLISSLYSPAVLIDQY